MTEKNVRLVTPDMMSQQSISVAYFKRHGRPGSSTIELTNGLTLTQNEDGLWLNFKSGDKVASVHLDMIGPPTPASEVRQAVDSWQADYAAWKDH